MKKQILIIRHIPYTKLLQVVKNCLGLKEYIIDVVSTTNIPHDDSFNKILLCPNDIYFNVSMLDTSFLKELPHYDSVVVFQSDFRNKLPQNIYDFVKHISEHYDDIIIVDDNYSIKKISKEQFTQDFINSNDLVLLPKRVSISVSDKCNLRCSMCYREKESSYSIMELDTVKKIPAQLLENAVDFELSGYGEIFVNKELFPIIEYLSTFPNIKRITFTTNGVLMTPDKIDKLIQYEKVDLVQISIDSLRKDIYEKIRVNAKFDEVINNIKYLSSVKPQWLSIYLKMVLTYDTIDDLLSMIRFAKEISADRLIAFPMHISKEINIKDSLYFNREKANRIYNQAAQLAKDLDVSLSTPPLFDLTKRSDPSILQFRDANRHPCHEPYEVIYIQSNGDIRPCCFSSDSYGNIFHDGVEETWYGKKYNHLRKTVNTEACPSYCKSCGMVEDVNNIFFLIRKGDGFREKGIKDKVNEYLKMNSPKI